jgi:hypothetical protein
MAESESRSKLFVRNLPYTATTQQLESLFGAIGPLKVSMFILLVS